MSRFLAKYALSAVPRYTSYPPATRFHDGIGEKDYRRWLNSLGGSDTLSLYVHVPFCRTLCWYCGCHTMVANRAEQVERYLDTLKTEVDCVAAEVAGNPPVVHLHFGGGTPNLLTPGQFSGLIAHLRRRFRFAETAEIAVEADPRCLSDDHAAAFAASGVNRVSLGVQDISPEVQLLINRVQPLSVIETAFDRLRRAGIAAINVDLMYGLPGQDVDHVVRSAQAMAALQPDRFAVFGYAHVPWFKKHQRAIDESRLPGGAERLAQAEAVAETLSQSGYVAIGLDHFARPGDPLALAQEEQRLRRNFQGYTVDPASALIGFGASSIGSSRHGFIQNEPHLGRYEAAIAEGRLPVARGLALDDDDRLRALLIERLMCDLEVDVSAVCGAFAAAVMAGASAGLSELSADGLVDVEGSRVRVTADGRPYVRNAAACFDAYHRDAADRHSRAV
jgi:oxygen-independent coproporphyrinogen-3 oxidase